MEIRRCTESDIEAYAAVQAEEWGESMAATTAQLKSRVDHVGEGILVAEHEGRVVGGATFIRLSHYDLSEHLSWNELTTDGWCTNHDPDGPILFGVDLTVGRRAPRTTSARVFISGIELAVRLGVDGVYWGSRLPRYHRYADQMSAQEYLMTRNQRGRYLDPEIQIYSRIPGLEVVGVVPDYFKDWESLDYGGILRWPNPVRRYPFLRPFASSIVSGLYYLDRRRRRKKRHKTR